MRFEERALWLRHTGSDAGCYFRAKALKYAPAFFVFDPFSSDTVPDLMHIFHSFKNKSDGIFSRRFFAEFFSNTGEFHAHTGQHPQNFDYLCGIYDGVYPFDGQK